MRSIISSEMAKVVMVTEGSYVCKRYSSVDEKWHEVDIPKDSFKEDQSFKEGDELELVVIYGKNGRVERVYPQE